MFRCPVCPARARADPWFAAGGANGARAAARGECPVDLLRRTRAVPDVSLSGRGPGLNFDPTVGPLLGSGETVYNKTGFFSKNAGFFSNFFSLF